MCVCSSGSILVHLQKKHMLKKILKYETIQIPESKYQYKLSRPSTLCDIQPLRNCSLGMQTDMGSSP